MAGTGDVHEQQATGDETADEFVFECSMNYYRCVSPIGGNRGIARAYQMTLYSSVMNTFAPLLALPVHIVPLSRLCGGYINNIHPSATPNNSHGERDDARSQT